MIKKIVFVIIGFYFLVLLQSSFFVHFSNYVPNFVLIAVVLINLFEKQKNNFGIISSLIGGFFLDVFFSSYIGYYVLISFFISIFMKFIFKRYVWQI
ncbi:MAG: rod shape-determining protein MreD [Promethearchaeota archaeon Loki_b32]|nr:MAG: rod shape-determining protein MreD [Candidatus Lokiarchaeota archaeon Loki_b32]